MHDLKQYKLSNDLGNALSVVADEKLHLNVNGIVSNLSAEVISYSDYFPFGNRISEAHEVRVPIKV